MCTTCRRLNRNNTSSRQQCAACNLTILPRMPAAPLRSQFRATIMLSSYDTAVLEPCAKSIDPRPGCEELGINTLAAGRIVALSDIEAAAVATVSVRELFSAWGVSHS